MVGDYSYLKKIPTFLLLLFLFTHLVGTNCRNTRYFYNMLGRIQKRGSRNEYDPALLPADIVCSNVSQNLHLNYSYTPSSYGEDRLSIKNSNIPVIKPNSSLDRFKGIKLLFLESLNISHILNGSFINLNSVEILYLHDNKLSEIPSEVLTNLPELEILVLSNNRIENVQDANFIKVARLKELYLQGNRLRYIRGNVFKNLEKLSTIDISNNPLTELSNVTFVNLSDLKATNAQLEKFDSDLSNLQLKKVDFSNERLKFIDFAKFSKVVDFDLSNNDLTTIDDWKDIESRRIKLKYNNISKIKPLPKKVVELNLSYNKINEVVFPEMLNFSSRLRKINLSNNPIKHFINLTFTTLVKLIMKNTDLTVFNSNLTHLKLEVVDLSNGNLTFFDLKNFSTIRDLNLTNNKLSEIVNTEYVKVKKMDLSHNKLKSWKFTQKNVRDLILSHNEIDLIEFKKRTINSTITKVNLSFNRIINISRHICTHLDRLKKVSLAHNKLTILSKNTFRNCSYLEEVNLSHNRLIGIDNLQIFQNVPSLLSLDISNNKLDNYNYFMLPLNNSVEYLYIYKNNLKTIDIELFLDSFTNLKNIWMNNNSWYCEDLVDILYNFKLKKIKVQDKRKDVKGNRVGEISCNFSDYNN